MTHLHVRAYAKLNLHLEVLGRRADGFHRLETIFQTIGLYDELWLEHQPAGAGITLRCDEPGIPLDGTNLVWRAAAAFIAGRQDDAGGLCFRLRKGIPHGAGLGGGSSDAAAALRLLASVFPHWHDEAGLLRLAATVGSDVPFFLVGGCAHGLERGEVLTALDDLPAMPVSVVMPPHHLATPQVFAALTGEERGPRAARGADWWRAQMHQPRWPAVLANRLTAAAVRLCPAVGVVLAALRATGTPSLMSGSGAACFALAHLTPPPQTRWWHTDFVSRARALAAPTAVR
jgi:4-diphosphocytidyl-2-C-methyl-D-erythritol kinase